MDCQQRHHWRATVSERRGKTREWFAREIQFTRNEKIETLGHEFGPGGPLVVEEIFALAKAQEKDAAGAVRTTFALLGARAFVSARRAKEITYAAEALGVLRFTACDPKGFTAELPNYTRWQVIDPTNAERQARHREKTRLGSDTGDSGESNAQRNGSGRYGNGTTTTGTSTVESKLSSRRASKINQDVVPDGFPDALGPLVEPVLERLFKVHSLRGGNVPTRRAVGLKLAAFPLRDHLDLADRLVYWATAGRGLHENRKDWVGVYGTFLEKAPDATPQRSGSTGHGANLGRFAEATGGEW